MPITEIADVEIVERENHIRALRDLLERYYIPDMSLHSFLGHRIPGVLSRFPAQLPDNPEEQLQLLHHAIATLREYHRGSLRQFVQEAGACAASAPPGSGLEQHRRVYPFDVKRLVSFPDQKPIFILGSVRSGTTAMCGALLSIASMCGWLEGHLFSKLLPMLAVSKKLWDNLLAVEVGTDERCAVVYLDIYRVLNQLIQACHDVYATATAATAADRWVDKSPDTASLMAVPLLNHIYPQAKYIFMHRHPLKVLLSRLRQFPIQSLEAGIVAWESAMATWHEVKKVLKPENYLETCQAHLSMRTDEVINALTDFLGLTREQADGARGYLRHQRPQSTGSSGDAAEIYLEDLDWPDVVKSWCQEVCGPSALAWGYKLTRSSD